MLTKKCSEFLSGDLNEEIKELVILGLNHEQQHQELFLTDLKYTFSCNPLYPVYRDDFALVEKGESNESETDGFVEINSGNYEIGFAGEGFHFDNELGRHTVFLHDFSISKNLVSNREFIEFIEDGGYENHLLWHAEGLDWVRNNQINAPLYWQKRDGVWMNYTLAGLARSKDGRAGLPRFVLRSVGICRMEKDASADRIRMGNRVEQIRLGLALGMDEFGLSAVSEFQKTGRRGRRI